ncbi:hypothetical protein PAHAL_2G111800 [Panicum hallii]|uniref:Uncharacterized protein n=1 Tax=Panicum hallii TaxID=206008 RepID=A0A2T8KNN1_9POAL|nr:hypothetical protein PAHAL_2G111800 [Panicum hallii]
MYRAAPARPPLAPGAPLEPRALDPATAGAPLVGPLELSIALRINRYLTPQIKLRWPHINLRHRESISTGRESTSGASNRAPPAAARPPAAWSSRTGAWRGASGHQACGRG